MNDTKLNPIFAVLIDDDSNCRAIWNMAARDSGKTIMTFSSLHEFARARIPSSTPIFVDWNLGSKKQGEEVLRVLNGYGFTSLYLYTGEEVEDEDRIRLNFIKGTMKKSGAMDLFFGEESHVEVGA